MNYSGAKWEMGQCTDKDIMYLWLKGRNDKRYSHFHISKEDAKQLYNDLLRVAINGDDNVKH